MASVISRVLVAGAVLGAITVDSRAHAFVHETVDTNPDRNLAWGEHRITILGAYSSARDVDTTEARAATQAALYTWTRAGATIQGEPCTDLRFTERAVTRKVETNFVHGDHYNPDGENYVVWRQSDWPDGYERVLAMTMLAYRKSTGEIVDADIDVNERDFDWTTTDNVSDVKSDVQNALTHEFGHLLGLAHSEDTSATMWRESSDGDLDKRSLARDDVDGICDIYPIALSNSGLSQTDGTGPSMAATCSVSHTRSHANGTFLAAVMVGLGAVLVGRRNRR